MLRELVPERLWTADMPARRFGVEYGARMTVLRLPDGGLWLHSPIRLTEALRAEVDALGPVAHLVAPSSWHREHVPEFAAAYPKAAVHGVAGAASRLPGLEVRPLRGGGPAPEWAGVLEQSQVEGSSLYDEVDFYHPETRTLILTDLCFNIPTDAPLTTRVVARALGVLGRLSISTTLRLTTKDPAAVRRSVERVLAWDIDRILLSHGRIVEQDGRAAFERAVAPVLKG